MPVGITVLRRGAEHLIQAHCDALRPRRWIVLRAEAHCAVCECIMSTAVMIVLDTG